MLGKKNKKKTGLALVLLSEWNSRLLRSRTDPSDDEGPEEGARCWRRQELRRDASGRCAKRAIPATVMEQLA